MKRLLFLFAVIACTISCSSDSGGSAPKSLVTRIVMLYPGDDNHVYEFTYDTEGRVSHMAHTSGVGQLMIFSYNAADKITNIAYSGGFNGVATLDYDSNNRLTQFASTTTYNITYNPNTDLYTSGSTVYSLNAKEDLDEFGNTSYTYNNSKKGAFYSTPSVLHYLSIFTDGRILFFGTKRPLLSSVAGISSDTFSFTNTYTDEGYIRSANVLYNGNQYVQVHYEYDTDI